MQKGDDNADLEQQHIVSGNARREKFPKKKVDERKREISSSSNFVVVVVIVIVFPLFHLWQQANNEKSFDFPPPSSAFALHYAALWLEKSISCWLVIYSAPTRRQSQCSKSKSLNAGWDKRELAQLHIQSSREGEIEKIYSKPFTFTYTRQRRIKWNWWRLERVRKQGWNSHENLEFQQLKRRRDNVYVAQYDVRTLWMLTMRGFCLDSVTFIVSLPSRRVPVRKTRKTFKMTREGGKMGKEQGTRRCLILSFVASLSLFGAFL